MEKKLYRYPKDGILFGIGSGIGRYFNVDPVFIRLAIVVLVLITGVWPGVALYIILFFIIPIEPSQQRVDSEQAPRDVTPDGGEPEVKASSEQEEPAETAHTEPAEEVERMDSSQNM